MFHFYFGARNKWVGGNRQKQTKTPQHWGRGWTPWGGAWRSMAGGSWMQAFCAQHLFPSCSRSLPIRSRGVPSLVRNGCRLTLWTSSKEAKRIGPGKSCLWLFCVVYVGVFLSCLSFFFLFFPGSVVSLFCFPFYRAVSCLSFFFFLLGSVVALLFFFLLGSVVSLLFFCFLTGSVVFILFIFFLFSFFFFPCWRAHQETGRRLIMYIFCTTFIHMDWCMSPIWGLYRSCTKPILKTCQWFLYSIS